MESSGQWKERILECRRKKGNKKEERKDSAPEEGKKERKCTCGKGWLAIKKVKE